MNVYVYDSTGTVYYAKGTYTKDETLYQISGDTSFKEPVIKSVVWTLHKDKSRALISIEAYSQDGTELYVEVGGEEAGYQVNNSYTYNLIYFTKFMVFPHIIKVFYDIIKAH